MRSVLGLSVMDIHAFPGPLTVIDEFTFHTLTTFYIYSLKKCQCDIIMQVKGTLDFENHTSFRNY